MTPSDPILELLVAAARAGDQRGPGPAAGTLPQLSSARGPLADPPAAPGPARCVRPGPGNVPESPPRVRASSPARANGSWSPGCDRSWFERWPTRPSITGPGCATSAARNRSTCSWIAQAWRSRQQLADSVASPSSHAVRREQAVLLADALARLPADYREVFILRNLEQVSVDEIAARMGRSPNAVRKLWGRAMVALKQAMEGSS